MNSPYRTHGVYWKPRTKADFIDQIIKSGRYSGTKTALRSMDIKQLSGKFKEIREAQFTTIMRTPIHLSNGQALADEKAKEVDNGL